MRDAHPHRAGTGGPRHRRDRRPRGSPIELDLRLESVVEGVLVSGTARCELDGECVRCLDPVDLPSMDVTFQELYAYPDPHAAARRPGPTPVHPRRGRRATRPARLEGDLLDLEPVLRDAVVLALPFQPVCRDDCPGLCSSAGPGSRTTRSTSTTASTRGGPP